MCPRTSVETQDLGDEAAARLTPEGLTERISGWPIGRLLIFLL